MSKAIEGAALLGGAVLDGVAMYVLASTGVGIAALPFLAHVMESLVVGGLALEAGAVASAIIGNAGMPITLRQTAANRQVIYGEMRVGGVIIYESTTGSSHDQRNFIIVLAGHECEAIVNAYLDGRQVYWQGSGVGYSVRNGVGFGGIADGASHTGPDGTQYNFGGTGHSGLYFEARFGDHVQGDVLGSLNANDPNWGPQTTAGETWGAPVTSTNPPTTPCPWIGGCCAVYQKLEFNTNVFPSDPQSRFTVRGKNNIWDPRDSTFKYTNNAALIIADVLTNSDFGLNDATVNEAQLIAAANVCDEMVALADGINEELRYTINWAFDTSLGVGDILETMLEGCAGRLSRIGGEWYIWPAYWQGPSFTFDESAITGPITWSGNRSTRDLFNEVRGTYIAPNYPYNVAGNLYDSNGFYNGGAQNNFPFAFQPTNFPAYAADPLHGFSSDAYLADDGRKLVKEVNFRCVISVAQAQRVAKIMLLRNRQQGSSSFPMSLAAFKMQPTDVMQFTFAENGWSNKLLEITSVNLRVEDGDEKGSAPTLRCDFGVQETDSTVYDWDPTTDELTVYDVPSFPGGIPTQPAPPTGLALTSNASTALTAADGIVTPRILAAWTAPADVRVLQVQIQHSPHSAGTWVDDGTVDVATTSAYISGVVAGNAYDVRIRSLTGKGQTSDWEEVDNVTVSAPNSLQNSYTNNPAIALTQPTSTTIAVAAVATTFGSATVNYAARTLTITAPSVPTWLYVSIADPTQQGESGSPTLTATASSSNSLAGVQGHTYIGAILALPAGGATQILAGGWPAPQTVQVQ